MFHLKISCSGASIVAVTCKMADSTLLREIQKGLISYVLKGELVDEKNSTNIGNGAYGTIRKIKYCGTPCAAKEMRSDLLPDLLAGMSQKDNSGSLIVERFCTEIKILSEIRHPNFVRFIGVYIKEGSSFPILVMELMTTSLANCITEYATDRQKFPLAKAIYLARCSKCSSLLAFPGTAYTSS